MSTCMPISIHVQISDQIHIIQLGPLSSLMKRKFHPQDVKTGIGNSKCVFLEHAQELKVLILLVSLFCFLVCVLLLLLLFVFIICDCLLWLCSWNKKERGGAMKFKFPSQPLTQGIVSFPPKRQ